MKNWNNKNWCEFFNEWSAYFPWPSAMLVVSWVISFGLAIAYLPKVTDVWNYVAIVKPELYLAKQAIETVKVKVGIQK